MGALREGGFAFGNVDDCSPNLLCSCQYHYTMMVRVFTPTLVPELFTESALFMPIPLSMVNKVDRHGCLRCGALPILLHVSPGS
ncbi:hypothetical protein SLA2020_267570 [Shorea laevis]